MSGRVIAHAKPNRVRTYQPIFHNDNVIPILDLRFPRKHTMSISANSNRPFITWQDVQYEPNDLLRRYL